MRIAWFTAVVCLAALAPERPYAQRASEIQNVELAAAAYVSARHGGVSIRIDPVFAESGTAPGVRTALRRPAHRNRLLADSLAAVVSNRRTVGSVYLLLSEPELQEQRATICVTAVYPVGERFNPFL